MKMKKQWTKVVGVGLAVLMLALAAMPAAAAGTVNAPAQHHRGPMGFAGWGDSDTYLAQALGITTAELQTAYQKANTAAIDKALAEGLITQAQADALKQRSGVGGRFWGHGLFGVLGLTGSTIDMDALLAEALGITTDELAAARVEAQNLALAAAVEAGYLTQEQADQLKAEQALRNYMQEQGFLDQVRSLFESFVQRAVQAGVITQAQADAILSRQSPFGGFGKFGGLRGLDSFRGMDGFRGMRGFWMPGMRGFEAPNSSTNPSGFFGLPRFSGSGL